MLSIFCFPDNSPCVVEKFDIFSVFDIINLSMFSMFIASYIASGRFIPRRREPPVFFLTPAVHPGGA